MRHGRGERGSLLIRGAGKGVNGPIRDGKGNIHCGKCWGVRGLISTLDHFEYGETLKHVRNSGLLKDGLRVPIVMP